LDKNSEREYNLTNMKTLQIADFAQGQKTITGLALFLLPMVTRYLGYDIPEESVIEAISLTTTMIGAILTAYGLSMKLVRLISSLFKK